MRIKVIDLKKYKAVCTFTMMGEDFVKTGIVQARNAIEAIDIHVNLVVDMLSDIDKYLTSFKMNTVTVQEIK